MNKFGFCYQTYFDFCFRFKLVLTSSFYKNEQGSTSKSRAFALMTYERNFKLVIGARGIEHLDNLFER